MTVPGLLPAAAPPPPCQPSDNRISFSTSTRSDSAVLPAEEKLLNRNCGRFSRPRGELGVRPLPTPPTLALPPSRLSLPVPFCPPGERRGGTQVTKHSCVCCSPSTFVKAIKHPLGASRCARCWGAAPRLRDGMVPRFMVGRGGGAPSSSPATDRSAALAPQGLGDL